MWSSLIFASLLLGVLKACSGQGLLGGLFGGNNNRRNGEGQQGQGNNGLLNLNLGLLNIRLGANGDNSQQDGNNGNIGGFGPAPPPLPPIPSVPCFGRNCRQTNTSPKPNTNSLKEFGLNWNSGSFNLSGAEVPNNSGQSRFYFFGHSQPNVPYGRCQTPLRERGQCRHLEYCVQNNFRQDYLAFIQYSCIIDNTYIGVCCPISRNNGEDSGEGFPSPRPTRRPNNKPNKPRPSKKPKPTSTTPAFPPEVPAEDPYDFGGFGQRQCGISEKQITRIVGGRPADPKAWPWMVALLKANPSSDDQKSGHYCGGVLISEFYVLTAAHCVDGFSHAELRIRLGEYNFNSTSDSRRDFDVVDIKLHEQYNRYSYQNDIAVIRLARSAYYTDNVRSICLPRTDNHFANSIGIVTGWGTIYYGGPTSTTLTEVLVPVWKQEDCKAAYTQPIEETNLCAGVRSGGRDSCQGDSGGPLQLQINGRWSVIGVVSWGIRCAEPGFPGIYTRITKYMDWIQTKIN